LELPDRQQNSIVGLWGWFVKSPLLGMREYSLIDGLPPAMPLAWDG
jgi:hypothetical protein